MCLLGVFNIILPSVSTHTVALLAIDRLIYIKEPLAYQLIVTPKRMLAAIFVVWVICIALAVPSLPLSAFIYPIEQDVCVIDFRFIEYGIALVVENTLVILLQCVMCLWMLCIARKQLKKTFLRKLSQVARFKRVHATTDLPQNKRNSGDVQKEYHKRQLHLVKSSLLQASLLPSWWVCSP